MFENNEDDYNINDFSDKEIINDILDLNNPTDRELEAKIVMMIEKYSDENSNSYNEKLSDFFNEIYGRFFDIEEDEEENEETKKEGFDDMTSFTKNVELSTKKDVLAESKAAAYKKLKAAPGGSDIIANDNAVDGKISEEDAFDMTSGDNEQLGSNYVNKFAKATPGETNPLVKKKAPDNNIISPWNDNSTINVRSVEYRRGWINPLIKETVKRVIYLDSQFRDLNSYSLSTDYTFNLSEPLADVLSIKLHSINIPYSWYTISTSFGANTIYLKGISPGINDGNHDIVIDISAGNYANTPQLIAAVDAAIKNLPNKYPDISFNDSGLTYDVTSTFTTLKLNINSTYTTSKLIFPTITNPYQPDSIRTKTIPGFLGFLNDQYESTVMYSNSDYTKQKTFNSSINAKKIPDPIELYNKDVFQLVVDGNNPNNFFTLHIKKGQTTETIILKLSPYPSPFKNTIIGEPKYYTRDALLELTNVALKSNDYLSNESSIELIDIKYSGSNDTMNAYQTYKLNIVLNRNKILLTEDTEQYITFPLESTAFPIWTGINSCFMFDSSYTEPFYKELGTIESDTSPMEMRYNVYSSPYVILGCIVDPSYSYRIDIPDSSSRGYTKEQYISVLNNAFKNQSINFDISLNILIEEDKSNNRLHFMVSIYKNIDEYTNLTELDYHFEFYDASGSYMDIAGKQSTSWNFYLGLTSDSYMLFDSTYNNLISDYSEFYAENPIRDVEMTITDSNNTLHIEQNGQIIPIVLSNGQYSKMGIYSELNKQFSKNPLTTGSKIIMTNHPTTKELKTNISLKVTTTYTTKDYELVFYDVLSRLSCDTGIIGNKHATHTTWDFTLGWILGFRDQPIYFMNAALYPNGLPNQVQITGNTFQVTGNTGVNVNQINQCFIVLDDFTQSHLNDGVVTMTNADKSIPLPSYSSRATFRCDPTTGKKMPSFTNSLTNSNLTQRKLYASQQINENAQPTDKYYSDPPYVKDLFALIPIKIPTTQGDCFVEYGGTLQDNDRKYFGPVNINRFRVQLLTDRGEIINLNNRNWSFSIVVECKYTANKDEANTKSVK